MELRSSKRAATGIAVLLLGIIFAIESSGSAGVIGLALGVVGLLLVVTA